MPNLPQKKDEPSSPIVPPEKTPADEWVEVLRQQVASLRFGLIQVVVHEGRVVQIERTEKYRLPQKGSSPS